MLRNISQRIDDQAARFYIETWIARSFKHYSATQGSRASQTQHAGSTGTITTQPHTPDMKHPQSIMQRTAQTTCIAAIDHHQSALGTFADR